MAVIIASLACLIAIALVLIGLFYGKKGAGGKRGSLPLKSQKTEIRKQETSIFAEEEDVPSPPEPEVKEVEGDFLDIFIKKSREDLFKGNFVPLTLEQIEESEKRAIRQKLSTIPPLPSVAHELIHALGDETISSRKVSEIAAKDPVLVGKLLQLVNSSFFGLSQEVNSIGRAIVLLGFNSVKNFVLQSQLSKIVPKVDKEIFPVDDFWVHSLATSVCAYHLSSGIADIQQSVLSTVGLLHDIGKLAMAFYKPEKFREYVELTSEDHFEPSIIFEEQVFGVNHALVGALLVESWELPDYIRSVILYHHHPTFVNLDQIPEEYLKAVTIIHFSDLISKLCGLTIASEDITGVRDEYFHLLDRVPPIELFIDQKTSVEIQKTKYYVTSQIRG